MIAVGNDRRKQIIGRTIVPFAWTADYNICSCKIGSWMLIKNLTKNQEVQLNNNDGVSIRGFTANENDILIFYGVLLN